MKLFFRRKHPGKIRANLGEKIDQGISWLGQRAASYLNKKTAGLSLRQRKIMLVVFCICFGSGNVLVLYASLRPSPPLAHQTYRLVAPRLLAPPKDPEPSFSDHDKAAIRHFRFLMDSLSKTLEGHRQLDLFLQQHPGFLDQFTVLEQQLK